MEVRPNQRSDDSLMGGINLEVFEGIFRSRDLCDAVDVRREKLAGSKRVSDQALRQQGQFNLICSVRDLAIKPSLENTCIPKPS